MNVYFRTIHRLNNFFSVFKIKQWENRERYKLSHTYICIHIIYILHMFLIIINTNNISKHFFKNVSISILNKSMIKYCKNICM